MSKRLTKTIWYGSDVDSNGNPILPSTHGGLDGLNYGELYLHLSNGKASLWTLSLDGKIVEITGGGSDVDMSSYLLKSIWDKVFEIRTDSQGTEYIFGKLPMVTQYGITMYSGDGVDIPSLASGLPFDGRTIWYNPDTQQIEVIGGTGGGSGEGVSNFWDLSGIPSWITNSKPKYTYTDIEGTPDLSGYATESWVLGKSYITSATLGTELGKYVTLDTDQSLKGKKDFKNGLSIDGLEIRKSQDDVVYIDANLVVRGGVTMYAQNEVDIPSIIDSIPTASTTVKGIASFDGAYFSVVNGKVSLIASNVGLNEEELYNYLTSNNYAKKSDIPSLVGYATQSWVENKKYLTAISSAMVTSAIGFTPFNAASFTKSNIKSTLGISDWALAASKPSYTTSEVSEGTNLYFTNTRAISALTETLKAYVTLGGTQTITGEKNFTGGLKVNGSPIYYDSAKKYWKLEGDLLVTGGVTMYGSDSSFTPSTIMDAILYDSASLGINSNGQLYVKGGAGGGINTTDLQNYLTQNSYLNVTSGDNRYLQLSGGMINGENDQVPLAISNTASTLRIGFVRNNEVLGYLGFIEVNKPLFYDKDGNGRLLLHERNYSSYALPLTGGRIVGKLQIQRTPSNIAFYNDDNVLWGHIGFNAANNAVVWDRSGANEYEILHRGNYSQYALPLTGGTLTVSSYEDFIVKRNANGSFSGITYSNANEGALGYIGVGGADSSYPYQPMFVARGKESHKIWHAGNDGSGSTLDADLLDGQQGSYYTPLFNINPTHLTKSHNLNDYTKGYYGYMDDNNPSNSFGYNTAVLALQSVRGADTWQIAFDGNNINYESGPIIGIRGNFASQGWTQWFTLATVSSNVASATKLQYARTIWGQSFDGTGNVSGTVKTMSGHGLHLSVYDDTYWQSKGIISTSWESGIEDYTDILVPSSGTNNARIRLLKNGNVGIGTTSPQYKLDVEGTIRCYSILPKSVDSYKIGDWGNYYQTANVNAVYCGANSNNLWLVGGKNSNEIGVVIGRNTINNTSNAEICRFNANGLVWAKGVKGDIRTVDTSIELIKNNTDSNAVYLGDGTFSPFSASSDLLSLGISSKRWNGVYLGTDTSAVNTRGVVFCNSSSNQLALIGTNNSGDCGIYSRSSIVLRPGGDSNSDGTIAPKEIGVTISANGDLLVTGGITMYSDQCKKTILGNVELSLKEIANAPLIEHYYNSDDKKTTHVGSIAQYWASMNDWFCKLDSEGYYTMEIQNAALASAISIARELDRYESKTDKTIKKLKQRICELEEEVERLKSA